MLTSAPQFDAKEPGGVHPITQAGRAYGAPLSPTLGLMNTPVTNRPLTDAERELAHYMLTQGGQEAEAFLAQLEQAEVTPWRCPCGCASINFQIKGQPEADPGVHVLADFVCGPEDFPSGAFIFESGGLLSGIEVYGLAGDAPKSLPSPNELRPFKQGS